MANVDHSNFRLFGIRMGSGSDKTQIVADFFDLRKTISKQLRTA